MESQILPFSFPAVHNGIHNYARALVGWPGLLSPRNLSSNVLPAAEKRCHALPGDGFSICGALRSKPIRDTKDSTMDLGRDYVIILRMWCKSNNIKVSMTYEGVVVHSMKHWFSKYQGGQAVHQGRTWGIMTVLTQQQHLWEQQNLVTHLYFS